MTSNPDLDIVIVSYNTCDLLRKTLISIPEAVSTLPARTFVVDNNSPDLSADMVAEEFPTVHLIRSEKNLGFAGGNNLALKLVTAPYVLLLNPDTEAKPGSLARLVDFLVTHPLAGVCGPMLLNSDGSIQFNGRKFPTPMRELLSITGLCKLNRPWFETKFGWGRQDFTKTMKVDEVCGACLLVRRDILNEVGLLDERFFMYYEEIEFCHRIHAAGWEIHYVAEAQVVHHWMGSVKQVSKKMTEEMLKSQILYYQMTGGPLRMLLVRFISAMGVWKNRYIHFGVAVKRHLRKAGIIK